ncbi:MarR family winged helix-turn-helix transcriptional regulator [Mesorhizobium xinjiangense]|uniref:MarR family winged helix-turn-helix transcriptional regulator n=1 Tax=Mesorhizobium xinjiangense TaxID=2678685 RepID=UPI0012EDABF8|nr:MarR family transcriptional regulator [Mesorhizobium xinjiangense]
MNVEVDQTAETAASLELENFLPYRLNRLADAVSREFARIYKDRHGLTRPEWRLLATLGQYGTMTATAVGAHSSMHKTKVSRAVTALEQRKWLVRETSETDRRVEHLRLTKSGATAYRELVPIARQFETRILQEMQESDRRAVLAGLTALEKSTLGD